MAKKAARARFNCPACGVTLTRADGVLAHMQRCCADLLPQQHQQEHEEQQTEAPQEVRRLLRGWCIMQPVHTQCVHLLEALQVYVAHTWQRGTHQNLTNLAT